MGEWPLGAIASSRLPAARLVNSTVNLSSDVFLLARYSGCAHPFLRGGGEKNQGFMYLDTRDMIGCGGDLLGI